MLAQVGDAEGGEVDGGEAGAQILYVAQETRLAPQGMAQVAQGVEDVARAGEEDADGDYRYLNQWAMWQIKRAGQGAEKAKEEDAARYDRREKCVEEDEKRGRFAQDERSDTEWTDGPPDKRVIFQQRN